jgi:hypothetical protein
VTVHQQPGTVRTKKPGRSPGTALERAPFSEPAAQHVPLLRIVAVQQVPDRGVDGIDAFAVARIEQGVRVQQQAVSLPSHRGKRAHPVGMLRRQTFQVLGPAAVHHPCERERTAGPARTPVSEAVGRQEHHLVVAEQASDTSPGNGRLLLQLHHELDHTDPVRAPVDQVADSVRDALHLERTWARVLPTWTNALRHLRDRIEGAGIVVVFNGVVGNNTHRKLDPAEFRGFALVDDYAPLIFVNGADYEAPKIFTLAHELVHVWIGVGGVSNLEATRPAPNEVERFCNAVAAEILVPELGGAR